MVHTSDTIRGTHSDHLSGRRIILGVSGSIAVVKTVELARALLRHGADVVPVMTPAACSLLQPDALHFATGNRPITALSGAVEHVTEFGPHGDADLFLVAPATANTIAKLALGIDDTALTTFASVALGAGDPVLIAPAMHGPMEENPPTKEHIEALIQRGVRFIRPLYDEGKAKLAPVDEIVAEVCRVLGPGTLRGERVLLITGPGRETVDPVRVLTNRSSGRMGHALAWAAHRLGADLTVLTSEPDAAWPPGVRIETFEGVQSVLDWIEANADLDPHRILVPAALGDHAPAPSDQKLDSDDETRDLRLSRLPKVLPVLREAYPRAQIVGWKLQDTLEDAVTAARERLSSYGITAMVANGAESLGAERMRAVIVHPDSEIPVEGTKAEVAEALFTETRGASQKVETPPGA
jgi:phosphopantothenoylcysteine decarboxylase / phosphopantothenate---cysteine ligase